MAIRTPGSASSRTEALRQLAAFPLVEALFGRRSRRFALGDELPDGPLAYRSRHQPMPLDELERLLVLSAMGGTTGWHYSITRHARYAPQVANYAAAAAGRTFPSAAGFHTAELFFTDDTGVWFFPTRDAGALVDPAVEQVTAELMVERHRGRLRRLAEGRLYLPAAEPYLEGHNTWCVNVPGSLLVIPVADIAQHLLAILCFFVQNGYAVYDDVHRRKIPGLEQFAGLVELEEPVPLTFAEQYALTEATAELACACYGGVLLLQAMGLGGGGPGRAQVRPRWPLPSRHPRCLERQPQVPGQRPGPRRGVQGLCGPAGPVRLRHLRQVPRHRAHAVHPQLPPGPPSGPGVLRPLLHARGLPAHPRRAHGPLAPPDGEGLRWGKHVGPGRRLGGR
jgi:hypothetical protein